MRAAKRVPDELFFSIGPFVIRLLWQAFLGTVVMAKETLRRTEVMIETVPLQIGVKTEAVLSSIDVIAMEIL
jgi:hypothetical protein